MENIIGREAEIKRLTAAVNSPKSELIALYGRRRVGKTFLINQMFKNQYAFKMTGVIEGTLKDQFAAFTDAMNDYGYDLTEKPKDWMSAFIMLKNALKQKVEDGERCVIFIDELPAMDAENSNVAGAVGYFWNNWACTHDNIVFIICGSATSWMISNVIDSKGGLHNRITIELPIHPFTLRETEAYLQDKHFIWNRQMALQAYMIFGGIPYYLSLLDREESLVQNVDRMFFSQDTQMRREFRRLFNTLYKRPDKYIDIVKTLSSSRSGMTREELATKMKCANNGHLGKQLEDLVYCDLIRKNIVREKEIKRKDAIYQLSDFFCLFYLSFIDRAEVEQQYWSHHINTPEVNTWMGLTYERICLAHVAQIKHALRIDAISTLTYSWRSKTTKPAAQIDIVIERADRIINICEVKFCQGEYRLNKAEYDKICKRKNTFVQETGIRHTPWLTLITTEGVAKGNYSDMIQSQVTLDDLFQ
ncbi:MAG: ATP-binding protein [Bacteroidaceae bacterium]|nr:ATP-binding protein [Bacteroidaceae bacterium]